MTFYETLERLVVAVRAGHAIPAEETSQFWKSGLWQEFTRRATEVLSRLGHEKLNALFSRFITQPVSRGRTPFEVIYDDRLLGSEVPPPDELVVRECLRQLYYLRLGTRRDETSRRKHPRLRLDPPAPDTGGVLSDDAFVRLRSRLTEQLSQIQEQLAAFDNQRECDMEVIRQILNLSRNIYDSYQKAPDALKRHYLGIFWDRFVVRDRKIVEAVPTELIRALQAERSVIFDANWLRW